jgi:hypothetical protein
MALVDRLNDGSQAAPRLRRDLNLGTLLELPRGSKGWRPTLSEQLLMAKAHGYVAVQDWSRFDEILASGMRATGMARILEPAQADEVARGHRARGLEATTVHLGCSFETDAEIDALVGAVLEASTRHGHPMFIETHRATATQDIWRTLRMVERFPDVRFNADLSHWYAGHEFTYAGEFMQRLERLAPVLARTRFMHGRIASGGAVQVPPGSDGPADGHFSLMWQHCFRGFLDGAGPGDFLSFNPELLPAAIGRGPQQVWIHYAQNRPTSELDPMEGEPSDRYLDADRLWDMACEAFSTAQGLEATR